VFDVIPILEAWSRSDARFAQTYWPWILLSQKEPLPENYLLGAPDAVFHTSAKVSSGQRLSNNMFQPIASRPGFMEFGRNIVLQRRLMSNTIVRIRKRQGESNVPCCIYGPKAVRSTLSTQKTAVHSAFGGNGRRMRRDWR